MQKFLKRLNLNTQFILISCEETNMGTITFDDTSKEIIFDALGLKKEGEILIDSSGKVVNAQDYDEIKTKEFGGVLKGSKIFIRNNSSELIQYFSSLLSK